MSYIGPEPYEAFTSYATETFTTSSTTSYTLAHSVANENELALFINNVRQQPGSGKAYTASGTALTLSAATASTDTMYAIYLGRALQTSVPHTNSVTSSMLGSNFFTGATDVGGALADADLLLMDDGAGGTLRKTALSRIKTYVGAANTPAFHVVKTSNQSIGNASDTKVTFDSETFDTASAFASDKFTVPAGEGGKYFIYCNVAFAADSGGNRINYLYKDGASMFRISSFGGSAGSNTFASSGLIVSLSAAEYLEIYTYQSSGGSLNALGTSSSPYTFFGGFKLLE